jgi:hypothetical protein
VAIIGYTDCVSNAAEGAVVFAKACELGLKGIVSKWEGSFTRAGEAAIG